MAKNNHYHPDHAKTPSSTRKTYTPLMDSPDEVMDMTPGWLKITLVVLLIATVSVLILREQIMAVFHHTTDLLFLLIGLTSLVLFVTRHYYPTQRTQTRFQKVLTVVLALLAVLYTAMGTMGMLGMLQ